ncbi:MULTISPECIES: hypothetical protein [unclassified Novosphingobium]|uniref:hypothetical protein n=1 Tax=unclassified Novosphingobium TaxID=2644732 RepID=UPI0025DFD333|nr:MULTISPECIES: hypothetical protein [unclassified Novosphingobium]HQS70897.1 hypothetical protein [Novosphingobium sp.]
MKLLALAWHFLPASHPRLSLLRNPRMDLGSDASKSAPAGLNTPFSHLQTKALTNF